VQKCAKVRNNQVYRILGFNEKTWKKNKRETGLEPATLSLQKGIYNFKLPEEKDKE